MRALLLPLLPLLLASTSTLATVPAWAAATTSNSSEQSSDKSTTHVLGFAANDHFKQAEALTKALKQVLSSSTNALLGEGDFSLEVLTAALGCSDVPDSSCLRKISNKTSTRRFLWGTLKIEGQKVVVDLHLFDDKVTSKKTQFSYPSNLTDSTDANLVGIAAIAVSELLEPLTYKVLINTRVKKGKVLVDGKVAGSLSDGEATLELTTGNHVFRIEGPTGKPVEETKRVRVDDLNKIRLDPPAGSPDASTAETEEDPLTEPPIAENQGGGNAQRTWGYITLGAGGVFLVAGGLAAGRLYMLGKNDDFLTYRAGLRSNEDACTEADRDRVVPGAITPANVRSMCSEGKTLEVAQIVLLATGVVAAGTGLTLLLTSKPSPKTATTHFEPRMTLGKDRTDLGFLMRF